MLKHFAAPQTTIADTFPLAFAASGDTVALAEICAGERLRKHLGELGLNVGMRVHVIKSDCGQMILAVAHDSRLAVGAGMAHKIMVKRCPTVD